MENSKKKAEAIVSRIIELTKDDNLDVVNHIVEQLTEYREKRQGQGEVISAVPLNKGELRTLERLLEKKTGKRVTLLNRVDANILGGLVIRYKDILIDQSVATQLKQLKEKVL